MTADLLAVLIKANLAATAAILLVLAVRKITRKTFGARLAYALWLAVPFAAGASLLPARKIFVTLSAEPLMLPAPVEMAAAQMIATPVSAAPELSTLALGLWLIGLIASGLLLIWRQSRFMASLGGVRAESGYLRARSSEVGPMVVGALRPRIIVPTDFESRFDACERDVVLAHEHAHLKSGDTRINAVVALAQCIAWFNPLVHVAARYLRLDQEMACDAAVLAARPTDRLLYANALLKAQTHDHPLPLGCYWPAGANPLKERIIMLKSQSPSRLRILAGATILTGICAGAGAAAWAAQPAKTIFLPGAVAPLEVATPQPQPKVRPAPVQLTQAAAYPTPPRPTQITPRPAPANPAPNAPVGADTPFANSAETPFSLVTKVASAKSKDDCLALFPSLSSGTNAEKTQRINEQATCLNQFSEMTPSLLREHMSAQGQASYPPRPTQITPRPAPANPAPNSPAGAAANGGGAEVRIFTQAPVPNFGVRQPVITETQRAVAAKMASARNRADCTTLFPNLAAGTSAENTRRTAERAACQIQFVDARPGMVAGHQIWVSRQSLASLESRVANAKANLKTVDDQQVKNRDTLKRYEEHGAVKVFYSPEERERWNNMGDGIKATIAMNTQTRALAAYLLQQAEQDLAQRQLDLGA